MSNAALNEQELKILEAAHAYADALAVLRGKPPFSAWDVANIELTRTRLLVEVMAMSAEREPGPSIPGGGPPPPNLKALMNRFLPKAPSGNNRMD